MRTITAHEARTRFGELLDRVIRAEEIVIIRDDKPVARVVPKGRESLESVRQAVQNLRKLREEIARQKGFRPITDKEIRRSTKVGRMAAFA